MNKHVVSTPTKGGIVVEPDKKPDEKLEDLLAGITDDNVHEEVDFGGPVGEEDI
jgi:antitoxin MazE